MAEAHLEVVRDLSGMIGRVFYHVDGARRELWGRSFPTREAMEDDIVRQVKHWREALKVTTVKGETS